MCNSILYVGHFFYSMSLLILRVSVPISVTTDNSIFSVYEFLAQNLNPVVTFSEERAPYFHFNSPR